MSFDEPPQPYSVMVEVKDDVQNFQTPQMTASDDDAARTVFNQTKDFNQFESEDTSIFVVLQDYEQEAIGAPQEVNLETLCSGKPFQLAIKDNEKQKIGDLTISGEWINVTS